jgi:hypothetical protein
MPNKYEGHDNTHAYNKLTNIIVEKRGSWSFGILVDDKF